MALGTIGAADHYEYAPTGDVVNTASRIEGLNKYLQTRILVSQEVIHRLDGFQTRELGDFVFVGKSHPIKIYELVEASQAAESHHKEIGEIFARALAAFRNRSWTDAIRLFNRILEYRAADGPAEFYLRLCERYRGTPPEAGWDGSVCMDHK